MADKEDFIWLSAGKSLTTEFHWLLKMNQGDSANGDDPGLVRQNKVD